MKGGLSSANRWGLLLAAAVLMLVGLIALEAYARLRNAWPYRMDVYDEQGAATARDIVHPVLRYAPPPDRKFTMRGYFENRLVFEFPYSIDGNGLRTSSPDPSVGSEQCILFFGGSTPFGEGVPDSETVPYVLAELENLKYKTYNFGYFYYGGHQMLASLETGLVRKILDCEPRYAIYFGYVAHVERAVFREVAYSQRWPLYILDDQGIATLDDQSQRALPLSNLITQSKVVQKAEKIVGGFLDGRRSWREDVDLYIAIVDKARRFLEHAYPGIEFHVFFWDERGFEESEYIVEEFSKRDFRMHFISHIFPDYEYARMGYSLEPEYMVSDLTWHLNGRAYRVISEYIAAKIVK